MKKQNKLRLATVVLLSMLLCFLPRLEAQNTFTFLQNGFTQTLFGNAPTFFGGIAFAPNGDVLVDECLFSGSPLTRFAFQITTPDGHGGLQHPQVVGSPLSSNAGCGLTNHPDGTLYSNTSLGVVNLDVETATQLRPAFGLPGNGLGITVDPQTKNIVYVASDCRFATSCTIVSIDPVSMVSHNLAVLSPGESTFADGIFFDPTGNFLFISNRSPAFRLTILDRNGSVVQNVGLSSEPDGIAFHVNPAFVVTSNTDGTITRFDFPNGFTSPPTQSLFASGGSRGDLGLVGVDGCLYLSQDGTRFADNITSSNDSVVKICPNFVPSPGVIPPLAYIANENSADVSVINTKTNTMQASIPVGKLPVAITLLPGQSRAYVANFGSANISVIDTKTNSVTNSISVGDHPIGIAVSPDGSTAYVANFVAETVSVISTANNTVTATIPINGQPSALAVSPDGIALYVANFTTNSLNIISTSTNTTTATIGVGSEPVALAVSPNGARVYVADLFSGFVTVVNPASRTIAANIRVGSFPSDIALTPNGNSVYVSNQDSSTVSVIQTSTNTVVATIPVGDGPIGVSVTPDGSNVYVTNSISNTVSAISVNTNTVSATVAVDSHPYGILVIPAQ